VLVVDASVLVVALADDGADGDTARARLRGEELAAPKLVDLEAASVLRRHTKSGLTDVGRAELALVDLVAMPLRRAPHQPLLTRAWELRESLTTYDAAYVSLAEALQVPCSPLTGALLERPDPDATSRFSPPPTERVADVHSHHSTGARLGPSRVNRRSDGAQTGWPTRGPPGVRQIPQGP
jgi:predicted nucleic acid-binding protein